MGRPLNKKYFGDPSTVGNQFNIEAWIPGGSGAVPAWILTQKTNTTYIVTDGSNTGRCLLQAEPITGPGQMRMTVFPFGFDTAAATATMKAVSFVSVGEEGVGYEPGDTIEIGGLASSEFTRAELTVGGVISKTATTVNPGTGSTPGDILTIIGGTPIGSASTITVTSSKAVSAVVSADGEGYVPGEIVTLAGGIFSSAATVEITNVDVFSQIIGAAGTGYAVGNTVALDGGVGTAPTFNIDSTKAVSATVADEGAGYSVANTLTVVIGGGTSTANAIFDIDTVGTVVGQGETDFNGAGSNGTFNAGSGYLAGDVITLSDGTIITVDAETGGVIIDFIITLQSQSSGQGSDGATLTQSGAAVPPGGTGFSLTLGIANQSVFGISLITGGNYTVEPTNDASTGSASGSGCLLTVLYGALTISQNVLGDLTVIPPTAATTAITGSGSGLTINVTYSILTAALKTSGSGYTTLAGNPVSHGITTGIGTLGTFTMDWGVDAATINGLEYSVIPDDDVATEGANGATFDVDWGIVGVTISVPGDYIEIPTDPVSQLGSSGGGTGATFFIDWGVLAITVTDDGGGYVAPPTVTLAGGSPNATATATLTTVGGSVPPDEAVASIAVITDGEGYSLTPTVAITGPVNGIEYIRILNAHHVKTFKGNQYLWTEFLAGDFDEADVDLS